jgi:hypothetical protein
MKYRFTDPDLGQLFSPAKPRVLSDGPIEEFIPHDIFEWSTSPAGDVIDIRQLRN